MSLQWSPPRMLPPSLAWPLFGLCVAMNLLLKGLWLGAQDVAMDEPFTIWWAQQPPDHIWALARHENNPPLHFLVEHVWVSLFGIGAWSVRFPSLIFSSLTAGVLFRIGNRHFGWASGLVAALLFSLSTEHIYYSHEARAYALLCLLTALALGAYLRVLASPGAWRHHVWLGVWNVLLLYTHFLGFWIVLAQVLCVPLLPGWRQALPRLLASWAGTALAYGPALAALLMRVQAVRAAGGTWVEAPHWTQLYGHVNIFLNGPAGTVGLLLGLAGCVFLLFWQGRWGEWLAALRVERAMLVAVAWFAIVYGGMYVQSLVFSPTFIPRYLLFSSVPFFVVLGHLGGWLHPSRQVTMIVAGLLCFGMILGLDANPPNRRDMRGLVEVLREVRRPGDPLIVCPGYFDVALMYHYDQGVFRDWQAWPDTLGKMGIHAVAHWDEVPQEAIREAARVVYLDADAQFTLPNNGILPALKGLYPRHERRHVEQIFDVWVMER